MYVEVAVGAVVDEAAPGHVAAASVAHTAVAGTWRGRLAEETELAAVEQAVLRQDERCERTRRVEGEVAGVSRVPGARGADAAVAAVALEPLLVVGGGGHELQFVLMELVLNLRRRAIRHR